MINDTAIEQSAQLSGPQGRMVDLLAIAHPGTWIDPRTAAALADVGEDEAVALLEDLVRAGVLRHTYALHDPGRRPEHDPITPEQEGDAFRRLVEEMLRIGAAAQLAITPGHPYLGRYLHKPPAFTFTAPDALAWMETERPTLVAVQRRAIDVAMYQQAWELAEVCSGLFFRRKRYPSWDAMYRRGLEAATAIGDLSAQAHMRIGLAQLHIALAEPAQAAEHARAALKLDNQARSLPGQALALECLGDAALALGRPQEARDLYDTVRKLYEQRAQPRGVALMKRRAGQAVLAAGIIDTARELLSAALYYFAVEAPEPYEEGQALLGIAQVRIAENNVRGAELAAESALEISRALGTPAEQMHAFVVLAKAADLQGDTEVADQYRQYAGDIEELLREERRAVEAAATW